MKKQHIENYTWAQFDEDCKRIAEWAGGKGFRTIYGIPRGGLVVAVRLSHLLNLELMLSREDITPYTLIVDDIVDKGSTLRALFRTLGSSKYKVASLFLSPHAKVKPSFHAQIKKAWVVFPWETTESSRYDGTLR